MGSLYNEAELKQKGEEILTKAVNKMEEEYNQKETDAANASEGIYQAQPMTAAQKEELRSLYGFIPDYLASFAKPDYEAFDPLIESIKSVETMFDSGDLGHVDTAKGNMMEWEGALSTNFVNNFLTPLPIIADNHQKIAEMLRKALEANQNLFKEQRGDASTIADQTLKAIDAIDDSGGADDKAWLATATAITSAAAIALTPITGGASAPAGYAINLALSVIGSSVSVGGNYVPGTKEEVPLGADTVEQVLNNMMDALNKVSTTVSEEEDKMVTELDKNYETLTAFQQAANQQGLSSPVIPLRPKLADATAGNITDGVTQND